MPEQTPPGFDEHCIVELLGHRKVAARVREHTLAGHGFLRLDEPDTTVGDGSQWQPGRTQLVSPSAVYAIHPTTEAIVRATAERWRDEPISRYDLPDTWRNAIQGVPADGERCKVCDHRLADHGDGGCFRPVRAASEADGEDHHCPCRATFDLWVDGEAPF